MEFLRSLVSLRAQRKNCVATIGNFDGIHLGHQMVFKQLKVRAKALNVIATVLLFEPQPVEFFSAHRNLSRLTRLREKLQQFSHHGIERVVCLRFDEMLANLSAAAFVELILLDALATKALIVGSDFRFAKHRQGDSAYLINAGRQHDFNVTVVPPLTIGEQRISSTFIRQALARGDMDKAALMLGRRYQMSGRVIHGEQLGRRLGFPTANIRLPDYFPLLEGIFSGRVYGCGDQVLAAVIYLRKPSRAAVRVLEVHLLDFNNDLYGQHLRVEFYQKLRSDKTFNSEHELVLQMQHDVAHASASLEKLNDHDR